MLDQMIERECTPRAQQVLLLARRVAIRLQHSHTGVDHIWLGLLRHGESTATRLLEKLDINLATFKTYLEEKLGKGTATQASLVKHAPFTFGVQSVFQIAVVERKALNHSYLGTEHLALGLLKFEDHGEGRRYLVAREVDHTRFRHELLKELDPALLECGADTLIPIQATCSCKKPVARWIKLEVNSLPSGVGGDMGKLSIVCCNDSECVLKAIKAFLGAP